jgi:hypothetical protein
MNEMRELNSNDLENVEGGFVLACYPPTNYCYPRPYHPHHGHCDKGYEPPYCGGDYDGGHYRIIPV